MGNFYTSFTVRAADHSEVIKAMKGRTAAISASLSGYTFVWDEECENQDQRIIERLGLQLSRQLQSSVLAMLNHDDDILWYSLYDSERKVDEYNSAPGYFDGKIGPPVGGNVRLLMKLMAPNAAADLTERVLRSTDYAFAFERHSALLQALNLPIIAAGVGYNYILNGELPVGLTEADLTFTE